MRKLIYLFAAVATAAVFTGCKGPEQKLARGFDNTFEVIRWGDMRRSVEQNTLFSGPNFTYSYGIIHGFNQSIKRIGLGVFEIATFPLPNVPSLTYGPICTNIVPATPQYPDSYRPGLISSTTFDVDTYTGFTGGDVAPFIPGSRFRVFDE